MPDVQVANVEGRGVGEGVYLRHLRLLCVFIAVAVSSTLVLEIKLELELVEDHAR